MWQQLRAVMNQTLPVAHTVVLRCRAQYATGKARSASASRLAGFQPIYFGTQLL